MMEQISFAARLASFNRKERYWLLRDALGAGAEKLSPKFLNKFLEDVRPSQNAWWAMDYHFDWIVAALWEHGLNGLRLIDDHKLSFAKAIKGSQEDIDLIIADGSRVWLCEAKFGGAMSSVQVNSKTERLNALKALNELIEPKIDFVEVDVSPKGRHERRRQKSLMKAINIDLDVHADAEFVRVVRTDFDKLECRDFAIEPVKI